MDSETTQNDENANQKYTTQEQILSLLEAEPTLTLRELAQRIGITRDGIKYHTTRLKAQGKLERVGSDRAGHWEVLR